MSMKANCMVAETVITGAVFLALHLPCKFYHCLYVTKTEAKGETRPEVGRPGPPLAPVEPPQL